MKLDAFNFNILHRSGKTNPDDAPLRRPDYGDLGEMGKTMEKLLPTLQRKLAILASVFSPRYAPVVGQLLTGAGRITGTRDPELQNECWRSNNGVEPAHCNRDIAEVQLNPVAGTVGCKQLVSRVMVRDLAIHKTANESPSLSLRDLL